MLKFTLFLMCAAAAFGFATQTAAAASFDPFDPRSAACQDFDWAFDFDDRYKYGSFFEYFNEGETIRVTS
ncbi:MAG: hypothetical protein GTO37_11690, partial [Planctomycetales bacterium]|nr:hypothetical protein [Planctomycetales bacterium]